MIGQDYILRQIEQLINMLAKILLNKETKNFEESKKLINNSFIGLLGIDAYLINSLSAQDLISLQKFSKEAYLHDVNCIIIAKLLKEQAELECLVNEESRISIKDYQKILTLFLEGLLGFERKDIDLAVFYNDVKEIVNKIGLENLSPEIKDKILKLNEQ